MSDEGPTTSENQEQQQNGEQPSELSKNQLRKRRRLEQWQAGRKERRKAEKARRKERRQAEMMTTAERKAPSKLYSMNESRCRLRVAVDLAYDELMNESTVRKMVSQLGHCYAANRRSPNPLQFYIVGLDGKAKELFDQRSSYQNWDAHIQHQPLKNLWADQEIVYLTADSDNTLTELDEQKVYVIGGLLDHNHHKGLCLRRAQQHGYAHAKLPIGEYVRMSTRKVLTINHVFEILVHYTQEQDWERAFLAVIPKRKGIEQLGTGGEEEEEAENADNDEHVDDDDVLIEEEEQDKNGQNAPEIIDLI